MMNCKDCLYYSESKRFYHPKTKKEIYFMVCKYSRRLRTRAYGCKICNHFENKRPTCNTCGWFVYETDKIGDWQHSEAVKRQKGFCLVKDLFTMCEPAQKACNEYTFEGDVKE